MHKKYLFIRSDFIILQPKLKNAFLRVSFWSKQSSILAFCMRFCFRYFTHILKVTDTWYRQAEKEKRRDRESKKDLKQ